MRCTTITIYSHFYGRKTECISRLGCIALTAFWISPWPNATAVENCAQMLRRDWFISFWLNENWLNCHTFCNCRFQLIYYHRARHRNAIRQLTPLAMSFDSSNRWWKMINANTYRRWASRCGCFNINSECKYLLKQQQTTGQRSGSQALLHRSQHLVVRFVIIFVDIVTSQLIKQFSHPAAFSFSVSLCTLCTWVAERHA